MITRALQKIRPGAQWTLNGDDYNGLTWLDTEQAKPTEAEIAVAIAELKAEDTATEYQRQRAAEYPSVGDQLDALFHVGAFPADMAAQIQAVKDKYPKT